MQQAAQHETLSPPGSVRLWIPLALAIMLVGCAEPLERDEVAQAMIDDCATAPLVQQQLFLGPNQSLQAALPDQDGAATGNAFSSGFATNDLVEWYGQPADEGFWLFGDVTLTFWARSTGSPAPLGFPIAGDEPGQAYQFFNQFGSDRTFQPSYATEFGDAVALPGTVIQYTETFSMPEGGFVVEAGDRLRLLLTDLALDSPEGGGHDILYGPATPSSIVFEARCFPEFIWDEEVVFQSDVGLPGNQGLLTGAVPAGPSNQAEFVVDFPDVTDRLTFDLVQGLDATATKDDIDIVLLNSAGEEVWSIGSPYSDESGTLWRDNLEAIAPNHQVRVQVNSYSGAAYSGTLTVTAAAAQS